MAEHFLTKTRINLKQCLEVDGQFAIERFATLQTLLMDRAGVETAELFAEPLLSRGNDQATPSVSWYCTLDGAGRPLDRLPSEERAAVEEYLSRHLEPLRALAADPQDGALVSAAMSLSSAQDIWVVNDRPVLINWGMMPDGAPQDAGARAQQVAATLGKYLPAAASSAVGTGAAASAAPSPRPTSGPVAQAAATSQDAGAPPVPPAAELDGPRRGLPAIAWVPLLILLLLAGGVLTWLMWPGTRIMPATGFATAEVQTAMQRQLLADLQARRSALKAAVDGATCAPNGKLVLPDGRTAEGLAPGAGPAAGPATADAALPVAPDRLELKPGAGKDSLVKLIEASTVMVVVPAKGVTGSGFVVAPGMILTNSHVVSTAGPQDEILVLSKSLAKAQPATVLKIAGPLETTGSDFALLKIDQTSMPAFELYEPTQSLKLHNVVAAGYPGDVLSSDKSFADFRNGDMSAVPGLTVTEGTINSEQALGSETHVLIHSAPISSGNSGGPLVDTCGRVVGVNTFVRSGPLRTLSFAMTTADIVRFLDGTPAKPKVTSSPCVPQVVAPEIATAAPPGSSGN